MAHNRWNQIFYLPEVNSQQLCFCLFSVSILTDSKNLWLSTRLRAFRRYTVFLNTIPHALIDYIELIWFSSTEHELLVNILLLSILPSNGQHLVCLNPFCVPSHYVYSILLFCLENKLLKLLILNVSLYNHPSHFTIFGHTNLPRRLETRVSLLQAKEEYHKPIFVYSLINTPLLFCLSW